MTANDQTIAQINDILNEIPKQSGKSTSVYISDNKELNEVIKSKDALIYKQAMNRITFLNYKSTVKEITSTLNIKDTKGTNGKLTVLLPFLFVFLFVLFVFFRNFYKKQILKRNLN